jgi:hypothetical protein
VAFLATTLVPVAALADGPKVLQVITVEVTGGRQAYLDKIKVLQGITKRLGLPPARVWRATLAGENTDEIYIATEYESLAALAAGQDKLTGDAEGAKLLRDIDASGIRNVVSRSVMVDDTPQ